MFVLFKNIAVFVIYAASIIVFFLAISGRVKYALWYLVPLFPLQNVFLRLKVFPFGKDLNDILLIAMIIGWIISRASQGRRLFEKSPLNIVLLLYAIYTYFTLWNASFFLGLPAPTNISDPRVQNWKNYMILPLLFFLVLNNTKDTKEMKRLFLVMCLTNLIMNYSTIREARWLTAWFNRNKIHGTFVWLGVNELSAFYAAYTLVIAGVFLLTKEKLKKILLGMLTWMNTYCILFLFSRGAYLSTLVGAFFISIIRNKKLLIPLVIILILWQTVLPKAVVERIQFTEQEEGRLDPSAAHRLEYWQLAMTYFGQNPLVGVGYNVMPLLGEGRDTHSIYFRTLAEQGIIGLAFLLIIMLLAFKRGWRLYRKSSDTFLKGLGFGFCACVLAVMAGNFVGDRWTYLPLAAFFWVFLGMVERGNTLAESKNEN